MSLWALAPSPLMLGNNLPDTDEWTMSLLTNDEVLAVNQDALGSPARRVRQDKGAEVWVKALQDGGEAVGLFNRTAVPVTITLDWREAHWSGARAIRNLWTQQDVGVFDGAFSAVVPAHGVVLVRGGVDSRKFRHE